MLQHRSVLIPVEGLRGANLSDVDLREHGALRGVNLRDGGSTKFIRPDIVGRMWSYPSRRMSNKSK